MAHRPLLTVLVSLLAAGLILCSGRQPNLRETWTFLAAGLKFLLVLSMLPAVLAGHTIEAAYINLLPGLALHLRADPFGLLFALLASGLWMITSLYSLGYMRGGHYEHQTGYFASFAVSLSATMGMAFAANLVTFLVFYELLTLATYPLVVHNRTAEAMAAGWKYLAYTLGAGQCLLLAIVWIQQLAPGATFQPGGFLAGKASAGVLTVLVLLGIIGVAVKAAVMPLHGWLPAAMVAPTPVSALLHAVAVVKAGTFGCIRLVHYVFGIDLLRELGADMVLASIAGATILLASIRALGESHLKRRLAYSTISQLSYIVLGAVLGSPAALAGAMFHMVAHGCMKITLFFCAGAIDITTHKVDITEFAGLGRQMPITFGAFTLGALGLAGTPLFVGFISKWNLGLGALQAGHAVFLAILVLSGILNFAYFFPIVYTAFFGRGTAPARFNEASAALWVPLAITALLSLVLGIVPNAGLALYHLAWQAADSLIAGTGHRLAGGMP
jgi:multicomponent Na+:H+ antiporter subunit D